MRNISVKNSHYGPIHCNTDYINIYIRNTLSIYSHIHITNSK